MTIVLLQNSWRSSREATLDAVISTLSGAIDASTDFVVLPENVLGDPADGVVSPRLASHAMEHLAGLARRHGSYLLTGSWPEEHAGEVVSVARLLQPDGAVLAELRRPLAGTEAGPGTDFPVVETDRGTVGILLGQDFWTMEVPRIQSLRGAELLLVAGSIGTLNRAARVSAIWGIATLNCTAVAFASTTGGPHTGGSTVAQPDGVVEQAGAEPAAVRASWDADHLRQLREPDLRFKQTLWFGLWARRTELYAPLLQESPALRIG